MKGKIINRILLVNDDTNDLLCYQRQLQRMGYEVHTADDPEMVLATTIDGVYDIILIDLNMPNFDGVDLLIKLRGKLPETNVQIWSGYDSADKMIHAKLRGLTTYVRKFQDPALFAHHFKKFIGQLA